MKKKTLFFVLLACVFLINTSPSAAFGDISPVLTILLLDENSDGDGDGFTVIQGDCNDNNAEINPKASEICGDAIDQDCNGSDLSCSDVDFDGDGFTESQGDCNDTNKNIYPGAFDYCGDGIDQDCSGSDQLCSGDIDNDGDGYT